MKRQNDTLRQFSCGKFGDLLRNIAHDPALLNWLDAPQNRKGHPNENLARELMELFTLGIGHYTEEDVKQAARALTGWTVRQGNSSTSLPPTSSTRLKAQRGMGHLYRESFATLTRQMVLPGSSATRRAPSGAMATPTGRP